LRYAQPTIDPGHVVAARLPIRAAFRVLCTDPRQRIGNDAILVFRALGNRVRRNQEIDHGETRGQDGWGPEATRYVPEHARGIPALRQDVLRHYMKSPEQLGKTEVRDYLL
jgi:hypothetical protein